MSIKLREVDGIRLINREYVITHPKEELVRLTWSQSAQELSGPFGVPFPGYFEFPTNREEKITLKLSFLLKFVLSLKFMGEPIGNKSRYSRQDTANHRADDNVLFQPLIFGHL